MESGMPKSCAEGQSMPAPLCAATSEAVPSMEAEQPHGLDQAQIAASAAAHTEQNTQGGSDTAPGSSQDPGAVLPQPNSSLGSSGTRLPEDVTEKIVSSSSSLADSQQLSVASLSHPPPNRTSSGGVRALAAMFEQRSSIDLPQPPLRFQSRSGFSVTRPLSQEGPLEELPPSTCSPTAAMVAKQPEARVSRSIRQTLDVPTSAFQGEERGSPQPNSASDPCAEVLTEVSGLDQQPPPSIAAAPPQPSDSLHAGAHAASDAAPHDEDSLSHPSEDVPQPPATSEPGTRAQGMQTDDAETVTPTGTLAGACEARVLVEQGVASSRSMSVAAGRAASVTEGDEFGDASAFGSRASSFGGTVTPGAYSHLSPGSSGLNSPALSPRPVRPHQCSESRTNIDCANCRMTAHGVRAFQMLLSLLHR